MAAPPPQAPNLAASPAGLAPGERVRRTLLAAFVAAFSVGLLIFDALTPRGTDEASLYGVAVLLSFGLSDRAILVTAIGTSLLTAAGFFLSPIYLGTALWITLMNRLVALSVIWLTALLGRARVAAAAQIRRAHKILQEVVEGIADPVFVKDEQGRMLLVNRAMLRVIGRPADQVIGKRDTEFYDNRELAEAIIENDRRVIMSGETAVMEERIPMPDRVHVFLSTKAPHRDEQGRVVGLIGVARDITDRIEAEATLREVDRAKDTFLAVLAHELKQPLSALRAAVAVLRIGASPHETARPVDVIERQVRYLARLVEDLTDASHIKRGKLRLKLETMDLREVLSGAVEALGPAVSAKGQELELRLPSEPIFVCADGDRMRQVFSNLLVNASNHTPQGGRIAADARIDGECAEVCVRDNGEGILTELLPHIFDLFVQGADTSIGAGMGIGLALAKGIVELHAGSIKAQSGGAGLGSTFTVTLPLCGAGAPRSAELQPSQRS